MSAGLHGVHKFECPLPSRGGVCDCQVKPPEWSRGFDYANLADWLAEGHYEDEPEPYECRHSYQQSTAGVICMWCGDPA